MRKLRRAGFVLCIVLLAAHPPPHRPLVVYRGVSASFPHSSNSSSFKKVYQVFPTKIDPVIHLNSHQCATHHGSMGIRAPCNNSI